MRHIRILIVLLVLTGCTAKFTIPDEPRYKTIGVYQIEDGICLDKEGMAALQGNIMSLKDYADKLRGILEGLQK